MVAWLITNSISAFPFEVTSIFGVSCKQRIGTVKIWIWRLGSGSSYTRKQWEKRLRLSPPNLKFWSALILYKKRKDRPKLLQSCFCTFLMNPSYRELLLLLLLLSSLLWLRNAPIPSQHHNLKVGSEDLGNEHYLHMKRLFMFEILR